MPLSPQEAAFMVESGSELAVYTDLPPGAGMSRKERRQGVRLYQLQKACGNLLLSEDGPGICMAFADPDRPAACGNFEEGIQACQKLRTAFGVTNTPDVPLVPVA